MSPEPLSPRREANDASYAHCPERVGGGRPKGLAPP